MKAKVKRREFIKHLVYGSLLYPILPYWSDLAEAQSISSLGRMILVYMPNGFGRDGHLAKGTQDNFTLGRAFAPLNPYKSDMIALSNLKVGIGEKANRDIASLNHRVGAKCLFSGHNLASKNFSNGPSVDQVLGNWHFKNNHANIKSLNLMVGGSRSSDFGSVHFTGPGKIITYDNDPVKVFEDIFKYFLTDTSTGSSGSTTTPSQLTLAQRLWQRKKSIIDAPFQELKSIERYLPKEGQDIIASHLASIRDLEISIDRESQPMRAPAGMDLGELGQIAKPGEMSWNSTANRDKQTETFIKLIDVAFRHNITRVASLTFGGMGARLNLPKSLVGTNTDHHTHSHEASYTREGGSGDPAEGSLRFVEYYSKKVAKLAATLKGESSVGNKNLLNETVIMYSSEAGATHSWGQKTRDESAPVILLGNPNGYYKTGKYHNIRGNNKAHQGILMSLAHATGATHISSLGDQRYSDYKSGPLSLLKA